MIVSRGGSGVNSHTAYSPIVGGTTSTGNVQSIAVGSTGQVLQSQGNASIPAYSTATYPVTAGNSGKVLISDGTNIVSSTPTFPNASATSRKIIVSDGTNWVASTETYAVPGTSGNVLTSNGTNWTSAAPVGLGYTFYMMVGGGNPSDAATYFMRLGQIITSSTSSGSASLQKIFFPKAGTITAAYGFFQIDGTLGSSENTTVAIRINNTTDVNVTTTAQLTAVSVPFSNSSLSTSVSAGDYFEIKMICPTWATNPTTVSLSITIYVS